MGGEPGHHQSDCKELRMKKKAKKEEKGPKKGK
jgi:hypothetical protein